MNIDKYRRAPGTVLRDTSAGVDTEAALKDSARDTELMDQPQSQPDLPGSQPRSWLRVAASPKCHFCSDPLLR